MDYSLTGSTKERTMAVLHGVGKNGKSTLVEPFQDLLGDYSAVANPNTLMQQKNGDATVQYQLAELTGARFVGISETKRDVQLEESVVKQITGNDTISARSPYGKPFGYRPQFKIWMSTNHKPEIPDGSEAIWDRMRLIPFTQRFEGKKADADLPEKLREELPGVLAWAIRGCVEWVSQGGLGSSEAVDRATAAYRAETDTLEQFFQDRCYFYPEARVKRSELSEAWEEWCDEQGENPGSKKDFTGKMRETGGVKNFGERKIGGTWYWIGISMIQNAPGNTPNEDDAPTQKYCKQGGSETLLGHDLENSENSSGNRIRVGDFSQNDEMVPQVPQRAPRAVTSPLSWETEDGLEIEYMPEGE